MLDGMSDSIQGSRIENLHSREVDRHSPTGLIFISGFKYMQFCDRVIFRRHQTVVNFVPLNTET